MKYFDPAPRRPKAVRPFATTTTSSCPSGTAFFPPQLYQRKHLNNPVDEQPFDYLSEFDYADDFDPMQVLETEAGPHWSRTSAAGTLSGAASKQHLLVQFEHLLAHMPAGQGASPYWQEPYYFPYVALLTLKGACTTKWAASVK